jgi:TatA/E family protein of Tat protein translocase
LNIGPTEIIVVIIIALLVFGPKRLPQMGRQLGRGVREFKKAADSAKNELGLGEVTDGINDIKSTISEPLKEVTGTFGDLKASVDVKSAIEAPVQAAGAAGAVAVATGAADATALADPTPAITRPGKPGAAVDEGPETPDVTPATVFADVTPPAAPEAPEAVAPVEAPAAEAPEAESPVEAPAAEAPEVSPAAEPAGVAAAAEATSVTES